MSEPMNSEEKKIARKVYKNMRLPNNKYIDNEIILFMEKFNRGEIKLGGKSLSLDEIEEWCKETEYRKAIITDNIFRKIILYAFNKGCQYCIGSWFGQTANLGNAMKYTVLKEFNEYVK